MEKSVLEMISGEKQINPHYDIKAESTSCYPFNECRKMKNERKEELKDEMKNRISLALKDPILQQGFEIICKENAELRKFREFLAVGSKLNKGLISRNKFLEKERDKYRNMVFDKIERLDRATEIIKELVKGVRITFDHRGFITDVDAFVSKAEQFLEEVE